MIIRRAIKQRIYPNKEQAAFFEKHFGCCRFVYNYFLNRRNDQYKTTGKSMSFVDTSGELTILKKDPDYTWLNEVSAKALIGALKNLDVAFGNYFKKTKAGRPKFKIKGKDRASFRIDQNTNFGIEGNRLRLPKMKPVKIVVHRPLEGNPKSVTISKTKSGKYFASILCEVEIPDPIEEGRDGGIDLGLTAFATMDTGEKIKSPRPLLKAEKALRRLQRQLSRKQKGSKRHEKARIQLARQHEKVTNIRNDFQHNLSRKTIEDHGLLGVESLNISGMLKNHSLAKHISDAGWYGFLSQLKYKGEWYGCRVIETGKYFPSSKACSSCGYVLDNLPLSCRNWTCPKCGAEHDRDINAAINERNKAIEISTGVSPGIYARGEKSSGLFCKKDGETILDEARICSPKSPKTEMKSGRLETTGV